MNLEALRAALSAALDNRDAAEKDADSILDAVAERADKNLTEDETAALAEARAKVKDLDADIEDLDAQVTDAEKAERSRERAAEIRSRIPALLVKPGAGEETRSDFQRFVAGETRSIDIMPERRDMVVGTAGSGGNTVPTSIYDQIVTSVTDQSPIAMLASRIDTVSGETINVPKVTALTAAAATEATAIAESDPTSSVASLAVDKYGRLIQFSSELLSDSAVNWEGWISQQAGLAVGNDFGADISADTLSAVTEGATAADPSRANLIDLYYSVQQAYRNNGAWIANSATAAEIRKLTATDDHWINPQAVGQPANLLGRPFYTDDTITEDGAVMFGDFSRGVMARFAGGLRIERSDDFAFDRDVTTWRIILRAGSAVVDAAAVKKLIPAE